MLSSFFTIQAIKIESEKPFQPEDQASISSSQPSDNYFHLQKRIYRWNDHSKFMLVYISTAADLPDWKPENVNLVKQAFAEWQKALQNRIMFVFVKEPSNADVVVSWWNLAQADVERGACGINRSKTWGKYIANDDIYISLHGDDGSPWKADVLYSTALHEIGHAIGIKVHSDNPVDIMAPSVSSTQHLTQRDINTINLIYAHKADYTNPTSYHLAQFYAFQKTQKRHVLICFPLPIPVPIPIPIPL